MVLPLTTPEGAVQHAGLDEVMSVIERIKPERAIINHMANECDYDRDRRADAAVCASGLRQHGY